MRSGTPRQGSVRLGKLEHGFVEPRPGEPMTVLRAFFMACLGSVSWLGL